MHRIINKRFKNYQETFSFLPDYARFKRQKAYFYKISNYYLKQQKLHATQVIHLAIIKLLNLILIMFIIIITNYILNRYSNF